MKYNIYLKSIIIKKKIILHFVVLLNVLIVCINLELLTNNLFKFKINLLIQKAKIIQYKN